jgi:Flp pilus assembly protein TadG
MSRTSPRFRDEHGQAAIEFSLVVLLMVIVVFGVIEVGRLALIYNTLADAARAGARYAIVHGSYSGSPSGLGNTSAVETQVTNITSIAGLSVTPTVSYPNAGTGDSSGNLTGDRVSVTASYSYVPVIGLAAFTPLQVTLTSTSEGRICY